MVKKTKNINETFSEEEFEQLVHSKFEYQKTIGKNISWHDFILTLIKNIQSKPISNDPFNTELDLGTEKNLW
jgi:hypothetical protein